MLRGWLREGWSSARLDAAHAGPKNWRVTVGIGVKGLLFWGHDRLQEWRRKERTSTG